MLTKLGKFTGRTRLPLSSYEAVLGHPYTGISQALSVFKHLFLFYVYACFAYMYVWCLRRSEEDIRTSCGSQMFVSNHVYVCMYVCERPCGWMLGIGPWSLEG